MATPDPQIDMTPQGAPAHGRGLGAGHELSDVSARGIVMFGIGLVVTAVVIHFILGNFMSFFMRAERRAEAVTPPRYRDETGQFPEPRSQVRPWEDLARFREREGAALNGYGWADPQKKVAHIPIGRAIDILAERGLPKGRTTAPRGSRTRNQPQ